MLFLVAEIAAVGVSIVKLPGRAGAAAAPKAQGFTVTAGDLHFIMKQIKISERHSATLTASNPCGTLVGSDPNQIPDRLTPYGLRTVDGSCNNLFPGRERFAAADELFPRVTSRKFRTAEPVPAGFPGQPAVGTPTTYSQKKGDVFDSTARLASNLIVDQTPSNPAALAATIPVRSQDPTASAEPCTTQPTFDDQGVEVTPRDPPNCVADHETLFIPNVTTDVGLSPPYNSWFTFFGQFFDHGVDQTVKSGANVFIPLRADDPLRDMPNGPDRRANTGDEVVAGRNDFMVLTRAQNQPGPDGVRGDDPNTPQDESEDDIQEATNTDTPLVDQSQTYTSHASHQAFLREYVRKPAGRDGIAGNGDDNSPVATGKLLGDSNRTPGIHGDTGMATWAAVKRQARALLGINLTDPDIVDQPMIATDPYGEYLPGPKGLPQLVTKGPDNKPNTGDDALVEGILPDATHPNGLDVPSNVVRFDTPFVGDIAHNADPSPNPGSTAFKTPDGDTEVNPVNRPRPAGTYDDELLDTHFCAGDGRANENIALSAVHQIFHSEHDRLINDIKNTIRTDTTTQGVADRNDFWQAGTVDNVTNAGESWNGDRLFQAARFVTEMEYQHLVFEEFARKIQPAIRPFHVYHSDQNPVIPAEFAHAVYRFGHSMLDDTVARVTEDANGVKTDHSLKLLDAFLNPPEYFNSGNPANPFTAEQAAGAIIMGSVDQEGNELDEFVTETLRNNLLGLPLDLPTINMTRAREAGVPPLNEVRREIHEQTNDAQMAPYNSWADYGQHLKHPESLINYVAAYGTHRTITSATTYQAKRAAARAIVDPLPTDTPPDDAGDFLFSSGPYANNGDRVTTGLEDVDLWVGGLGEFTNLFGGLLGSTFNYVFQNTLENLQETDRFYYLNRLPGLNLRVQLEGNSFAELVERNTDGTHSLKGDVFATADCEFEIGHLTFPANTTATPPRPAPYPAPLLGAGSVNDDPTTDCDENQLLVRNPTNGRIEYRQRNKLDPTGINGQSIFNGVDSGPNAVDRIFGGNDNDTIWGNGGGDILDGQGGDDIVQAGDGNDIVTDLDGADVLEGGDGNDAIDAGTGDDLILAGNGVDFTNAGSLDNETFGGPGGDFINAGQGADVVFGDGGDDWIQGGSGQDLLQADHGAFFFDDPGDRITPGNEIFVGEVGENDYDAEGGDDVMAQNSAIDRNAGAAGFDWAYHQYDTVGADDDMIINNNLQNNLPVVVNRDRWQETEADSGSPFNDIMRGDDETPSAVGGGGFTGCDALDAAGLARISGLAAIVPSLATAGVNGVIPANQVATADGMTCPLVGNVWGDGNIMIGGGGGDVIEGRGGNDIIDGDRALHTRIVAPGGATTTLMDGKPVDPVTLQPIPGGTFGPAGSSMNLQQAVFAGVIDPGTLRMVREIVVEGAGTDTAVFSGPQADYDVTFNTDGSVTVNHARGTAADGVDTLRNVENLRFGGINGTDVSIAPAAALAPPAGTVGTTVDFGSQQIGTTGATRAFTLTNTSLRPLTGIALSITGADATSFVRSNPATGACGTTLAAGASCTVNVAFRPAGTTAGARNAALTATNNAGTQSINLTGNATVAPVNRPATGTPTVTPAAPRIAQALNAAMGTVADPDGISSVQFRWYRLAPNATTFDPTAIATSTDATAPFTATLPVQSQTTLCAAYKVGVTVTDSTGHAETELLSAPTARATNANGTGCANQPAPAIAAASTAPVAVPLGQALAPALSPAPLTASSVRVSGGSAPLAVSTTVPAGANTVAISVFRMGSLEKRTSAGAKKGVSTVHVGTVYRKVKKAKRYVFRLTDKPFRNLKPGRYLVQVRVGKSRTALGPATSRQVTVKRTRSKIAR